MKLLLHITSLLLISTFVHGFSWGLVNRRSPYTFTGVQNTFSKLALSDLGYDSKYRSLTPPNRTANIGAYSQDKMYNFNSFLSSSSRVGGDEHVEFANSGKASGISDRQITSLANRPSIMWNVHTYDYNLNQNSTFTSQTNGWYYNFLRTGQNGNNLVNDTTQSSMMIPISINLDSRWDNSLYTIAGQAQPNETHGNRFNKVIVPIRYQDFSINRPAIFQTEGGLPRLGANVYSKESPVDGPWKSSDSDVYLNYYPSYGGSELSGIPSNKVGMDWYGLHVADGVVGPAGVFKGYSTVIKVF